MTATDLPVTDVAVELETLSRRFMERMGKLTQKEALEIFMDDETISEEARLIASDSVESIYRGSLDGSMAFAYGTGLNLDVAARRVHQKR